MEVHYEVDMVTTEMRIVSLFKPWLCTCFCDFRHQESQGTKYRAQLLSQNEMHSHKQGPHCQCQVSYMEGRPQCGKASKQYCYIILRSDSTMCTVACQHYICWPGRLNYTEQQYNNARAENGGCIILLIILLTF